MVRRTAHLSDNKSKVLRYLNNSIFSGIVLLVFVLPLLFCPLTEEHFDLPKATFLWTMTALLAATWLIKSLLEDKPVIKRTSLDIPIILFLFTATLSTITSIYPPISWVGFRFEGLISLLSYGILFFLIVQIEDPLRINTILRTAVISAVLVAIYGLLQSLGLGFIQWKYAYAEGERAFSTLGNPVLLGGYLALMLPISLSLLVYSTLTPPPEGLWGSKGGSDSLLSTTYYLISTALIVIALIFTYSRGAWLGMAVGIILTLVLIGKNWLISKKGYLLLSILFTITFLATILIQNFAPTPESFGQPNLLRRLNPISEIKMGSVASRLEIWKSAFRMIAQRPLLGWGSETFHLISPRFSTLKLAQITSERADNAHNYFLQITATIGLWGLASLLAIFFVFFWTTLKKTRQKNLSSRQIVLSGLRGGTAAYVIQLMFGVSALGSMPIFWIVLGIVMGMESNHYVLAPWQSAVVKYRKIAIVVILLLTASSLFFLTRPFLANVYFATALRSSQREAALDPQNISTLYERAISLAPYEERYYFMEASFFYDLAKATRDLKYLNPAIEKFRAAQEINPQERASYIALGQVYFDIAKNTRQLSYYSSSVVQLQQALMLAPYDHYARRLLATVYYEQGQYREAIKQLKIALKIKPFDEAFYLMGLCYEALDKKSEAIKAYRNTLEINSNHRDAENALKRLESG